MAPKTKVKDDADDIYIEPYDIPERPNSEPVPASQAPFPKKRVQVKNACVNCQKACKKCDDGRPCMRCIKYGLESTCVNSARKERRKGKRGPYKKKDIQIPSVRFKKQNFLLAATQVEGLDALSSLCSEKLTAEPTLQNFKEISDSRELNPLAVLTNAICEDSANVLTPPLTPSRSKLELSEFNVALE